MLKRKNGKGGVPGLRADFQTLLQRAGLVGEDAEVFVLGGHGGRIVGQGRMERGRMAVWSRWKKSGWNITWGDKWGTGEIEVLSGDADSYSVCTTSSTLSICLQTHNQHPTICSLYMYVQQTPTPIALPVC